VKAPKTYHLCKLLLIARAATLQVGIQHRCARGSPFAELADLGKPLLPTVFGFGEIWRILLEETARVLFHDGVEVLVSACQCVEWVDWRRTEVVRCGVEVENLQEQLER
jgi:hypothetical protein